MYRFVTLLFCDVPLCTPPPKIVKSIHAWDFLVLIVCINLTYIGKRITFLSDFDFILACWNVIFFILRWLHTQWAKVEGGFLATESVRMYQTFLWKGHSENKINFFYSVRCFNPRGAWLCVDSVDAESRSALTLSTRNLAQHWLCQRGVSQSNGGV